MLRLVCTSTVTPLAAAVRAIASPKIRFLSIANALRESPIVSGRHFSTDSVDRRLVGALKSQIKALEWDIIKSADFYHAMTEMELGDEKIKVTVNPFHDTPEKDSDSDSSTESDCDSESGEAPPESVRINVSISKENKGTLDLGANVSADEILVNRISFSQPNTYVPSLTYFAEADELQDALWEFVKARGVKKSCVGFLYSIVETRKRCGNWAPGRKPQTDDLKKLMKFVQDWHR